jgi:hypothetical protein
MDGLMFNDQKEAMGFYVTGMGLVKSIWHQSFTGVEVRQAPTILPEMVPGRILAPITVVAPIDPETFDPVQGLGLIKLAGVRQRLGHAGGRKRVNWTPCQQAARSRPGDLRGRRSRCALLRYRELHRAGNRRHHRQSDPRRLREH